MSLKKVIVLKSFVDVNRGSFIKNQHIEIEEDIANIWIEGNLVCENTVKKKRLKKQEENN